LGGSSTSEGRIPFRNAAFCAEEPTLARRAMNRVSVGIYRVAGTGTPAAALAE
jgi:hypothetical protein